MKKNIITGLMLLCSGGFALQAQTSYGTARLMVNSDLTGTARYVGMGGAMGALGGDISVMSTNPAGTGIYRSSDINIGFSVNSLDSKARFMGNTEKKNKTDFDVDHLGFLLSNAIDDSPIRFVNFGFNYKRSKGFSKDFTMFGSLNNNGWIVSQQQQMAAMLGRFDAQMDMIGHPQLDLKGITSDNYIYPYAQSSSRDMYYAPWLVLLGADAGLIDNETGECKYLPADGYYHSEEKGGITEYDFNLAVNLNDRIYLGATVGLYDVDYNRYSYYDEYDNEGIIYSLENWYRTEGHGFDIKLGAIFRPLEESSFRLGFAVHTPTWYRLTDTNSAYIYSSIANNKGEHLEMDTRWSDAYGGDYYTDYRLHTPWRFNVSTAYTIGSIVALGAEYEYVDYPSAKLKYDDGNDMQSMNNQIKYNMRCAHTFKIGAEMKLASQFSFRVGYNYMTAAFDKSAYNFIPDNSVLTDTEYLNALDAQNYTFGVGYSGESFYIDLSDQLSRRKGEFYPFDNTNLTPTEVTDWKNSLLLTVGMRF